MPTSIARIGKRFVSYQYPGTPDLAGTSASVSTADADLDIPVAPGGEATLVWNGDFSTGDFIQYPYNDLLDPKYNGVPLYGAPPDDRRIGAGGTGDLLEIVTSPLRDPGDSYSARFLCKNSANGTEPADCDPIPTPNCSLRRCSVNQSAYSSSNSSNFQINSIPYLTARWFTCSVYLPTYWDTSQVINPNSTGDGVAILELKHTEDHAGSLFIRNAGTTWVINHYWGPNGGETFGELPCDGWQTQMFYTSSYPNAAGTDSGADLRADFPNQSVAQAALASVLTGGWTDWIVHWLPDRRGVGSGGTGFLDIWKREEGGSWIKILEIRPRVMTRGGCTFDRGIGISGVNGFYLHSGMYSGRTVVWNADANREYYMSKVRILDGSSTFAQVAAEFTRQRDGVIIP